jgi:hypothetical protein
MRVPGHAARDIDKKHRFKVVGAVDDAFGKLVEGGAACIVDYVGDLSRVLVRFDLAVTFAQGAVSDNGWKVLSNLGNPKCGFGRRAEVQLTSEHVSRTMVLSDDVAVNEDLTGVALVATSDNCVHVLHLC